MCTADTAVLLWWGPGVSSGGSVSAALRLSAEVNHATIVCIICDRGDRYLSTGAQPLHAMQRIRVMPGRQAMSGLVKGSALAW